MNDDGKISVTVGNRCIYIDFAIFNRLFEHSPHVYYLSVCQRAVEQRKITLRCLIELARKAQIPYSLFFLLRV